MWKPLFIFFVFLLPSFVLSSCVGPEQEDTPANAVVSSYAALSRQDSAGYMQSLSHDREEVFEALPAAQQALLHNWKGDQAEVRVLSVKQNNGVATVLYNLTVTGRNPSVKDSLMDRAYLEDDGWKVGY